MVVKIVSKMIGEDRIQLNERFIKVFEILEKKGEIKKNDRSGRGMGDFAEKLLGNRAYGHIIRAFLNRDDKRVIDYKHARALCREFNINESYMIDGVGTPFGMDLPKALPANANAPAGNILFTTTEAFAGDAIDTGQAKPDALDYFSVPGLNGHHMVSFPIKGDSMEPIIKSGDIVICKEINGPREIKDNMIYAVRNNGAVWIKYLQRIFDNRGSVAKLKLISANHLEYDPFVEEVNEYTKLYEVIRRITAL